MKDNFFHDEFSEFMFEQAIRMKIDRDIEKYENLPHTPISKSLDNRITKLINSEKKKESSKKVIVIFKKIGVTVTACFIIFSISMLTVPEVRAEIRNTFLKWFDKYSEVSIEDKTITVDVSKYKITPPNGFTIIDEQINSELNTVVYMNDDKIFTFSCMPSSGSLSIDNENLEFYVVDEIYQVFESEDMTKDTSIIWQKDKVNFSVGGNLSVDELLEIAKSVE
jgi:hypothetical protein